MLFNGGYKFNSAAPDNQRMNHILQSCHKYIRLKNFRAYRNGGNIVKYDLPAFTKESSLFEDASHKRESCQVIAGASAFYFL